MCYNQLRSIDAVATLDLSQPHVVGALLSLLFVAKELAAVYARCDSSVIPVSQSRTTLGEHCALPRLCCTVCCSQVYVEPLPLTLQLSHLQVVLYRWAWLGLASGTSYVAGVAQKILLASQQYAWTRSRK